MTDIGRPELAKYIVAVRHCMGDWPKASLDKLDIARKLYCAGTHEMCQGRDGQTIIQYLIPRKHRVPPREFPDASTILRARQAAA